MFEKLTEYIYVHPCDGYTDRPNIGLILYGLPWHFDIRHEERFQEETDALPYDAEKVRSYLQLLDGLDFSLCISGHSEAKSREDLYDALKRI